MEQNLISRNYRPKWLDKKRVLQIILLLAICMWLLHHVDHQNESYNIENPQNHSERNITIVLGRRGIHKYINAEFPLEYERRDGGVGDDEIDGNVNEDVNNVVEELVQEAAKSHIRDAELEKVDDVEAFLDENGIPPDASYTSNEHSGRVQEA